MAAKKSGDTNRRPGETVDELSVRTDEFQSIFENSAIYQETREVLQATERELRAGGVEVKVVTRSGNPAREILKIEEEEDVSGVVMGSHDSSGLQSLFAGSVAEAVVHKSKRTIPGRQTLKP